MKFYYFECSDGLKIIIKKLCENKKFKTHSIEYYKKYPAVGFNKDYGKFLLLLTPQSIDYSYESISFKQILEIIKTGIIPE